MGNRAVITLGKEPSSIGIYLHWNGGPESVKAFLEATRQLTKSRGPDRQYTPARLIQVIGNYLGGSLSPGIGIVGELDTDNGDNGTYIVDPGTLEIVGRKHARGRQSFDKAAYERTLAAVIEKNTEPFGRGS